MLPIDGGALGSSPGGALAAPSRIRLRRSGAITPLTGPPGHLNFALGSFDQPSSTLIPGPSAPVTQSTICTYPGSPARFSPATARLPATRRQTPIEWRNKGSWSLRIGVVGKVIGGSLSASA